MTCPCCTGDKLLVCRRSFFYAGREYLLGTRTADVLRVLVNRLGNPVDIGHHLAISPAHIHTQIHFIREKLREHNLPFSLTTIYNGNNSGAASFKLQTQEK